MEEVNQQKTLNSKNKNFKLRTNETQLHQETPQLKISISYLKLTASIKMDKQCLMHSNRLCKRKSK